MIEAVILHGQRGNGHVVQVIYDEADRILAIRDEHVKKQSVRVPSAILAAFALNSLHIQLHLLAFLIVKRIFPC